MDINGTYKISLELTARKQVQGLVATTHRLLGMVGDMPEPPGMEEHVQAVVQSLKQNQGVFDAFVMDITDEAVTIRTEQGKMVCAIEERTPSEHGATLRLESKEMGPMTWTVTLCDRYLLIDSNDSLSEYAFERM